jgi:hypothetical protein
VDSNPVSRELQETASTIFRTYRMADESLRFVASTGTRRYRAASVGLPRAFTLVEYTYSVSDLPMFSIPPFGTLRYAAYVSTPFAEITNTAQSDGRQRRPRGQRQARLAGHSLNRTLT